MEENFLRDHALERIQRLNSGGVGLPALRYAEGLFGLVSAPQMATFEQWCDRKLRRCPGTEFGVTSGLQSEAVRRDAQLR